MRYTMSVVASERRGAAEGKRGVADDAAAAVAAARERGAGAVSAPVAAAGGIAAAAGSVATEGIGVAAWIVMSAGIVSGAEGGASGTVTSLNRCIATGVVGEVGGRSAGISRQVPSSMCRVFLRT